MRNIWGKNFPIAWTCGKLSEPAAVPPKGNPQGMEPRGFQVQLSVRPRQPAFCT